MCKQTASIYPSDSDSDDGFLACSFNWDGAYPGIQIPLCQKKLARTKKILLNKIINKTNLKEKLFTIQT